MRTVHFVNRTLSRGIPTVLVIILIVIVWFKNPALIVKMLDFNLVLLKTVCQAFGNHYGPMIEVALRESLSFEKVFLIAEAELLVKGIFALLRRLYATKTGLA